MTGCTEVLVGMVAMGRMRPRNLGSSATMLQGGERRLRAHSSLAAQRLDTLWLGHEKIWPNIPFTNLTRHYE